ncbi:MAG: M15 family metallopeptidase, partial [Clostridia bacterium]|nr:M15 family metallopeptidase [Clostridia bacterium]
QQEILERFTEQYGAEYAAKTVAQPGYSEHHTGLALDLYFRIKNADGSFTDVYRNEDMEKEAYKGIWTKIHARLADHGFILRYLPGKEHVTGYRYEPWHIRYLGSAGIARKIMSHPGLTLEEYLTGREAPAAVTDPGKSAIYADSDLENAILTVKCRFASLPGCELRAIRYAGDKAASKEDLARLNARANRAYAQTMVLLTDFRTASQVLVGFEANREYKDHAWRLARTAESGWEIVGFGDEQGEHRASPENA